MAAAVESPAAECERFSNLQLAFSVALHSLLTACPREEFTSHFLFLKPFQQDALYKLYMQMVVAVQETLEEEFADICEETRVIDALDDRLGFGQEPSDERITCAGKEMVIQGKTKELEYLKQTLQKIKERNYALALKLEVLKDSVEVSGGVSTDAVLDKLRALNAKLGSAVSHTHSGASVG